MNTADRVRNVRERETSEQAAARMLADPMEPLTRLKAEILATCVIPLTAHAISLRCETLPDRHAEATVKRKLGEMHRAGLVEKRDVIPVAWVRTGKGVKALEKWLDAITGRR